MPDQSEVSQSLVTLIADALYPNGTASLSTTGDRIFVYAGWPVFDKLSADLANGIAHVSIWPQPNDKIDSITATDDGWQEIGPATISREVRRQTKAFKISAWASTPDRRDNVGMELDIVLSTNPRMTFADNSQGTVAYVSSMQIDDEQKAGIYRRDLNYSINYATTQSQSATPFTNPVINIANSTTTNPFTPF